MNNTKSQPDVVRNKNGTFAKGSIANPKGRPRREVETRALEIVAEKLDDGSWEQMITAMVNEAKKGNVAAFNSLRDMYAGKPTERHAIEADAGDDIQLRWSVIGDNKSQQSSSDENGDLSASPDGNP